jgi:hypothetical protein
MKNLAYKNPIIFVFFVNLLLVVFVISMQSFLPPVVPLLYGLPKGEEQLVPKLFLASPALASELVLIVNALLIKLIKDDFLQKSLFYLIVAVCALCAITTLRIFFLVGSV